MAGGLFIVFEGGEGAGKSTQAGLLADHLTNLEYEVVRTREPGGVPTAEAIRDFVLDPGNAGLNARAEALLFAAARAEHVSRLIRPALERGATVLCDRYIDSSLAYQGVARELGVERIAELSDWATDGLLPDLTIVLDIEPETGLERAGRASVSPDRMESEPNDFHAQVRQAFLDRAAANPERYLVLSASDDVLTTQAKIVAEVAARLGV